MEGKREIGRERDRGRERETERETREREKETDRERMSGKLCNVIKFCECCCYLH
jgi:hypothetical protein